MRPPSYVDLDHWRFRVSRSYLKNWRWDKDWSICSKALRLIVPIHDTWQIIDEKNYLLPCHIKNYWKFIRLKKNIWFDKHRDINFFKRSCFIKVRLKIRIIIKNYVWSHLYYIICLYKYCYFLFYNTMWINVW